MKVKICGMRDPRNIREVAKLKPDLMGFIFAERSPRRIELGDAAAVCGACPAPILRVGVFADTALDVIREAVRAGNLHAVQLHGKETPEICRQIGDSLPIQVIKAFGVDEEFSFDDVKPYESCCDLFLFDAKTPAGSGGSGTAFDWKLLSKYRGEIPFLVAGGIGSAEIREVRRTVSSKEFFGLDLNSRLETSPGLKSMALAAQALQEARA